MRASECGRAHARSPALGYFLLAVMLFCSTVSLPYGLLLLTPR
jgi:hypothetical protein